MSNDHASIYRTQTCPLCSDKAEFELSQDFHCPRCGRRKSLFLQELDSHSSGLIFDKVVYLEDQVRVWKENYEELERLAREQVAKLERSANTAWEQVRLADNNLHIATNALLSIQSHAIGSAYVLMVCNDALAKLGADKTAPEAERGMSAAWAGWQAAVKVEREACADVCMKRARAMRETIRTADPRTSEHIMLRRDAREDEARECATAIMERSNAEVTGADKGEK